MYLKPGAEMRAVAENDWEKEVKSRDTTYFLWIAIPIKLGLLIMVLYCVISGNDINRTVLMTYLGISFAWFLIVTPMIYGLKRSLMAYACLAAIVGVLPG